MVQYCIVPECKNNALIPGIRFHTFPTCPRLKKLWEIKIRRDSRYCKPISSTMRVCSKHFIPSDYRESHKRDKLFLKRDAVPSVFSFNKPKNKPRRILHSVFSQKNTSSSVQDEFDSDLEIDDHNGECLKVSRTNAESESVSLQDDLESELNVENCLEVRWIVSENIDIPSQSEVQDYLNSSSPLSPKSSNQVAHQLHAIQNTINDQKRSNHLEQSLDLKEENEKLKIRIDLLTAENAKLEEKMKNSENAKLEEKMKNSENVLSDFKKRLKEKEAVLSEVELALRISTLKEQRAVSLASSLREKNIEMLNKVNALENITNQKMVTENELRQRIKNMEAELIEKKQEAVETVKLLEIVKANNEERIKAMKYTCEVSKDFSQKFAKSQDQYEEVVKKNMDLLKENKEAKKNITKLLEEIKALKKELSAKKNECSNIEKNISVSLQEDFESFLTTD